MNKWRAFLPEEINAMSSNKKTLDDNTERNCPCCHKDSIRHYYREINYREETTLASFYLYHHMDWSPQIWAQIFNADLSIITSELQITQCEAEWYRDTLYRRHSESKSNLLSQEYTEEQLFDFSRKTAYQYIDWLK